MCFCFFGGDKSRGESGTEREDVELGLEMEGLQEGLQEEKPRDVFLSVFVCFAWEAL